MSRNNDVIRNALDTITAELGTLEGEGLIWLVDDVNQEILINDLEDGGRPLYRIVRSGKTKWVEE